MTFQVGRQLGIGCVSLLLVLALTACDQINPDCWQGYLPQDSVDPAAPSAITGLRQSPAIASFDRPWALEILPGGRFLVSQRNDAGGLTVVETDGRMITVEGLPATIGLLDVALAADFGDSGKIYFTAMVRDPFAPRYGRAAADPALMPEQVEAFSARLELADGGGKLVAVERIFRQDPALVTFPGSGEPGGRIAVAADGNLFITSGDRQELDTLALFSLNNSIGKIMRIRPDGSTPEDNPYADDPEKLGQIWSFGHRNAYGLAFAPDGKLWSSEHGPRGGDEFNLIRPGAHYGWNAVSNGLDYSGADFPDHAAGDCYAAPKHSWTPVISPAGMIFYTGEKFADWRGDALLTGLSSQALVRVRVQGDAAAEMQRIDLGARIRDIAQAADGSLYIITDGASGELRRIDPVF